ncbi:sucrose transport protein SUT2 [Selaginella moellendorffii]|uniref:sucrose transport protein SUT2 n=1 Tax=Selaginella moellendorffii TaxID=88036 RepID=UPI000D1CA909|nr:sucrose transport protein SUT2 [Selaginella moellendorffii]XP_024531758.1 sucrose transport protein SUT2 [Selaginella moellendorffii]|eukprot:XP_024531757.1 sucrose transport protein SUT2 [Selaginella moellendorffii]
MDLPRSPRRLKSSRVPLRSLARVACVAAGVQFGWALQLSLLTPYVQELGIPHTFASYIWLCGPISGMLVQPIVGYYSDNCESKYGRRRPFILLGAVSVVIAVVIISFAADLGFVLGDSGKSRPRAIVVFILGFWLLDLANNTLQGPCRALLADFTGKDQRRTRRANAFFSLFIALGNILGFAAGSYNSWPSLFPFTKTKACELPCANLKSAFLLDIIILLITTALSVTAAAEIPWLPLTAGEKFGITTPQTPLLPDQENGSGKTTTATTPSTSVARVNPDDEEEEEEEEEPVQEAFIWELLGTFKELPRPMWYIMAVTALTWFAWFPFLLFDTDWMGREVYRGEPNSSNRLLAYLYDTGVRTGSLGLMLNSVVLGLTSLLIEPSCRRMGASNVWGIANVIMSICFALTVLITLAAERTSGDGPRQPPKSVRAAALAVFAVLGAPLAVTYSVPYALTATFTSSIGGGQGLSMGVLNLAVVLPQVMISLGSGPWDALFGGGNMPSFLLAAAAALLGGILAIGLLPRPPPEFRPTGLMRTRSSPIP